MPLNLQKSELNKFFVSYSDSGILLKYQKKDECTPYCGKISSSSFANHLNVPLTPYKLVLFFLLNQL
jgi:hypothetical protein